MTKHTPLYIAVSGMGWLVTANADGSIPINARILCEVKQEWTEPMSYVVEQFNGMREVNAELVKALEATIKGYESFDGYYWDGLRDGIALARAAIAKVRGNTN